MRGWRWSDIAIAAAGLLGFALLVWLVIVRPGQNAREAATARGEAVVATGEAKKAGEAVVIVQGATNTIREIERVTVQGNAAILAAPGAASALPADVAAAGRRALCLHPVYHGDPACEQLPHAGAGQPEGGDPARPAAR
jgi:hypothetical protein